ncbi:unnamed protein product [Mucor hiemalis]
MSAHQIPNEIVEEIVRLTKANSKEPNAYNCALVCKSWHLPACRVLYVKINIPRSSRKLLQCLPEQRNNLGHFCKVLSFWSDVKDKVKLKKVEFAKLLSYLPNVKRVELPENAHTAHYLSLLQKNSHLISNMQAIVFSLFAKKVAQLNNECLFTYRTTLKQMELNSPGTIVQTADGRSGDIISYLSEFKSMQDLQVHNIVSRGILQAIPQLKTFEVMRSCPHLKRFIMSSTIREPEDDFEGYFDHSELKCLGIYIPDINKKQIDYIVSNVTKLTKFNLSSGTLDLFDEPRVPEDWMKKIGSHSLSNFFDFLAKIDCVNLSLGDMFAINIAKMLPLVRRVVCNREQLPVHLTIVGDNMNINGCEQTLTLEKGKEDIFLRYGLDVSGIFHTTLHPRAPTIQAIMPFDYSEMNIQSILLHLRPDRNKESKRTRFLDVLPSLDIIESVLNDLPNLHYLHVKLGMTFKKALQIKVASEELKFDPASANILMGRETPRLPVLIERFKHVVLQNIESTKALKSILQRLPNTVYLKLFDSELEKNRNSNIVLDLGNLHLQYFMFDIGKILDPSAKQDIVLRIEEKQSNETVLYRWETETKDRQVVTFQRIRADFFKSDKEFRSPTTTFLIIQCFIIEEIKICLNDPKHVAATIDIGNRDK